MCEMLNQELHDDYLSDSKACKQKKYVKIKK